MTEEEKEFWENYKKRALEGIEDLLKRRKRIAAAKLIFIAIENFGSWRLGRDEKGKVLPGGGGRSTSEIIRLGYEVKKNHEAFDCFLKEYIKDHSKEFFDERDVLWNSFRNGLIHDGIVANGHSVTLSGNMIKKSNGRVFVNAKKLFDLIKNKSLPKYDRELDDFVLNRWRKRYKYLKK